MEIARRMVGREVSQMFPPKRFPDTEHAVLSVEHLSSGREVRDVSFFLGRGITGLAGLAGAGRTELAEAICALRKARGAVRLNGKLLNLKKPSDAIAHGIVYLSEDRALPHQNAVRFHGTAFPERRQSAESCIGEMP